MNVELLYFAVLRECAGKSAETRETESTTARDLYAELEREYGFPLPFERIRVAVGERYVDADIQLEEGMEVTFIPPVAGG